MKSDPEKGKDGQHQWRLVCAYCMMTKKHAFFFFAAAVWLTGIHASAASLTLDTDILPGARTYLPGNYEEEPGRFYPALYLLPEEENGPVAGVFLETVLETVSGEEAMDLIVICPDLEQWEMNTWEETAGSAASFVQEADSILRTIDDPRYRAVAGTGAGGYLASMLAWTGSDGKLLREPLLFGMTGSIGGDYSDENPWCKRFGSFAETIRSGRLTNAAAVRYYTFMRAASEEETAYEADGANEVISLLIRLGAAYGVYTDYYGNADETVLDLQIVHGEEDDRFLTDASCEFAAGMSHCMMKKLIRGEVYAPPVDEGTSSEEIISAAEISVQVLEEIALFGAEGSEKTVAVDTEAVITDDPSGGKDTILSLRAGLLGMQTTLDEKPVVYILSGGLEPGRQLVDLMGEWYFYPSKSVTPGVLPDAEIYHEWETVVPALGWWDSGFSKTADMKGYGGYGWYVREFTMPEHYPAGQKYLLSLGGIDETDICFVNGQMAGHTGLDPDSWTHTQDCWDTQRLYEVDPAWLHFGETNEIIVLTHNASGDGGWYSGHPTLYSPEAYESLGKEDEANDGRYEQITFPSGSEVTDEVHALVYLPEDYNAPENADKRYPVFYLLHQLNSTGRSYVLDGIDVLLDEAVRSGELEEVIVVMPDSSPNSWWMSGWDDMVTDELIPYIDEHYRTIAQAQGRYIGGASMGGHGAYHIALKKPDLFSGVVSFFGALNMGSNPLRTIQGMDAGKLGGMKQYFICGNRDLYKFGPVAIVLDQYLRSIGIDHYFALGEGGHDSAYYLPHFIEALQYVTDGKTTGPS